MSGPLAAEQAAAVLAPLGDRAVLDGPIGPLTTYRVGGKAAVAVTVARASELELVAQAVAASGLPVLVVGRGSNLLVSDGGFPGLAVILDADGFGALTIDGGTVEAGAALPLPTLARRTVEARLTGLEWAVGVPGSVGGGVRMNAGGHGSDIAATLIDAVVFDLGAGQERTVGPAQLAHRYRHSNVAADQVVVSARFGLVAGDREAGLATIRQIVRWRREHQPGGQNAGSVFTNPPGDSAGRLIDVAGLKGRRLGTAMVSTKHANFIQADPDGSADDVYALLHLVQRQVAEETGVELAHEVRLVGFSGRSNSQVEVES